MNKIEIFVNNFEKEGAGEYQLFQPLNIVMVRRNMLDNLYVESCVGDSCVHKGFLRPSRDYI